MGIDKRIVELVDKGLAGQGLEETEIAELLQVNPYTAEGSHVRWGGWMLSRKASDGVAEIHAQIGMDASACFRLAVGVKPRLCGNTYLAADSGSNYGWAEVGTNPRDAAERTGQTAGIGHGVMESKYGFASVGWKILEGPSQGWRL